jgi:hypothetical protein
MTRVVGDRLNETDARLKISPGKFVARLAQRKCLCYRHARQQNGGSRFSRDTTAGRVFCDADREANLNSGNCYLRGMQV